MKVTSKFGRKVIKKYTNEDKLQQFLHVEEPGNCSSAPNKRIITCKGYVLCPD